MGIVSPFATVPIHFVGSFPDPRHPLDPPHPEIAFLGRSNVGKSSLLNALFGGKAKARVSRTPGKTHYMNIYQLPMCYLVDLPGYGYARASKAQRTQFRLLIDGYVKRRQTIAGIVWLLDVRHPPSAEDRVLRELLSSARHPTLVVLTKIDKFARGQRATAIRARAAELDVAEETVLPVSSTKGLGIVDLADSILATLPQTES